MEKDEETEKKERQHYDETGTLLVSSRQREGTLFHIFHARWGNGKGGKGVKNKETQTGNGKRETGNWK
jgi:hypothetical protein